MTRSDYTPPTFTDVPQAQWPSPPGGAVALDSAHLNAMAQAIANSQRQIPIDPRDYGAKGDGVTDDTAALQSALSAADAAGSGTVDLGGRTYLAGKLALYPSCSLVNGSLKLKASTNDWMVTLAASATRPNRDWLIDGVSFDGNKANNPTMPGVIYGYCASGFYERCLIRRVRIMNARGECIKIDSNAAGGAQFIQPRIQAVTIDCSETASGTVGVHLASCSDGTLNIVDIGRCYTGVQIDNSGKHRLSDVRAWACTNVGVYIANSGDVTLSNCEVDGNFGHGAYITTTGRVHWVGCALTNNAFVDTTNSLGYGTNYNSGNSNNKDGIYIDNANDIQFTNCRFGNDLAAGGSGYTGTQRYGITTANNATAVVDGTCLFYNNRTAPLNDPTGFSIFTGRSVRYLSLNNGSWVYAGSADTTSMGFPSSTGAGIEVQRGAAASNPGRLSLISGGAANVGAIRFLHSDGAGNFLELAQILPAGGLLLDNQSAAPATPVGGGVLYVQAGALKYIGSSGTVTTLGPA